MEININFDEASILWKQNKKSIGNGMYVYTCEATCKNGKSCSKKLCFKKNGKNNILSTYCFTHFHLNKCSF